MAKLRKPAPPETPGGIPAELLDQLHPVWSDAEALAEHPVFGRFVDESVLSRLAVGSSGAGRVVYWRVATAWMLANGFTDDRNPRVVDLHKFHEVVKELTEAG